MKDSELCAAQTEGFAFSTKYIYFIFKRLFDILFSILGIVCLLPLAILIKILHLF